MDASKLSACEAPWLHLSSVDEVDEAWQPGTIYCKTENCLLRVLRGHKMATKNDFMNEIGAAMQFPDFFGENWHAVKDLLEQLDQWMPSVAYVIYFSHADKLLEFEREELHWLLVTLQEVAEFWAKPVVNAGYLSRASVPFHVIFKCDADVISTVADRLSEAAAGHVQIDISG
jgi:hypothetical protein